MAIYGDKFKDIYSDRREEGDNTLDVVVYYNAGKWVGLVIIDVRFVAPDGQPTHRTWKHIVQAVEGTRSQVIRQAITIFDGVDIGQAVKDAKPKWELR